MTYKDVGAMSDCGLPLLQLHCPVKVSHILSSFHHLPPTLPQALSCLVNCSESFVDVIQTPCC